MKFLKLFFGICIVFIFVLTSVLLAQNFENTFGQEKVVASQNQNTPGTEGDEVETIDCSYDVYPDQKEDFENSLRELSEPRDIEVRMRGRPKKIIIHDIDGNKREKIVFDFTLTGRIRDIEEMLYELDSRFEDSMEDRD